MTSIQQREKKLVQCNRSGMETTLRVTVHSTNEYSNENKLLGTHTDIHYVSAWNTVDLELRTLFCRFERALPIHLRWNVFTRWLNYFNTTGNDFEQYEPTNICNHHVQLPDYFIQKLSSLHYLRHFCFLIVVSSSFVFMQNVNTQSGEPKKNPLRDNLLKHEHRESEKERDVLICV